MSAVQIINLSKVFPLGKEGVHAVRSLSFTVAPGEFFVLVGPSGSGKTTLLRLIAALEKPTSGSVAFGGAAGAAPAVGMVFQQAALFPHLNVRQNLGFGLMLAKRPKAEVAQIVNGVAAQLSLGPLMDRMPSELSGGEQQRVSLGRVLAQKPALILFDEPLSNLDLRSRAQIRAELKRLNRESKLTFVYVTHDQSEALALADRMAVVHQGEVQQIGAPAEIYRRPANLFVAKFIGAPEINTFRATLENGEARIHGSEWRIAAPKTAGPREVVLAVRPEDVLVESPSPGGAWTVHAVEFQGWEQHLQLAQGSLTLLARVTGAAPFALGNRVSATIRPEALLLYDSAGPQNLLPETLRI